MPLYTYVMSWKGRTRTLQVRRSNFTGWTAEIIREAFPDIPASDRLYLRPEPVPNTERVWQASSSVAGSDLLMHIIQTRD